MTAPMVGAPGVAPHGWRKGGVMQLGTRLDPGDTRPSGTTAPATRTSHGNSTGNQRQFKVNSRSIQGQFKVNSRSIQGQFNGALGTV